LDSEAIVTVHECNTVDADHVIALLGTARLCDARERTERVCREADADTQLSAGSSTVGLVGEPLFCAIDDRVAAAKAVGAPSAGRFWRRLGDALRAQCVFDADLLVPTGSSKWCRDAVLGRSLATHHCVVFAT
jgi:hypothetical protein